MLIPDEIHGPWCLRLTGLPVGMLNVDLPWVGEPPGGIAWVALQARN